MSVKDRDTIYKGSADYLSTFLKLACPLLKPKSKSNEVQLSDEILTSILFAPNGLAYLTNARFFFRIRSDFFKTENHIRFEKWAALDVLAFLKSNKIKGDCEISLARMKKSITLCDLEVNCPNFSLFNIVSDAKIYDTDFSVRIEEKVFSEMEPLTSCIVKKKEFAELIEDYAARSKATPNIETAEIALYFQRNKIMAVGACHGTVTKDNIEQFRKSSFFKPRELKVKTGRSNQTAFGKNVPIPGAVFMWSFLRTLSTFLLFSRGDNFVLEFHGVNLPIQIHCEDFVAVIAPIMYSNSGDWLKFHNRVNHATPRFRFGDYIQDRDGNTYRIRQNSEGMKFGIIDMCGRKSIIGYSQIREMKLKRRNSR